MSDSNQIDQIVSTGAELYMKIRERAEQDAIKEVRKATLMSGTIDARDFGKIEKTTIAVIQDPESIANYVISLKMRNGGVPRQFAINSSKISSFLKSGAINSMAKIPDPLNDASTMLLLALALAKDITIRIMESCPQVDIRVIDEFDKINLFKILLDQKS